MESRRGVRRVVKYVQVIGFDNLPSTSGQANVKSVLVEPHRGRVNIAHVATAVHEQMGKVISQLVGVERVGYCFFNDSSVAVDSLLRGDTQAVVGLPHNRTLGESDGSESNPLYLITQELAWITLVKTVKNKRVTSSTFHVPLRDKRLMLKDLDEKTRAFQCSVSDNRRFFVTIQDQRIPLNLVDNRYFNFPVHDARRRAWGPSNSCQIIVADDEYFDHDCTFSSKALKKHFDFNPERTVLLIGTYADRFKAIRATPTASLQSQDDRALKLALNFICSHFCWTKKGAGSANEMAVRSMVSHVLYAAVDMRAMLAGAVSEQLPGGDMSEQGGTMGTSDLRDSEGLEVGARQGGDPTLPLMPGERSSMGPLADAGQPPVSQVEELLVDEEMDVEAIVSTGRPEWKFIKVHGRLDYALRHTVAASGPRADATLVTLEAKTLDSMNKDVSVLQAFVENRAIMELRRAKGRGWMALEGVIHSYFILTNGIEWRFYRLEGKQGEVEVKGAEDHRNPVMVKYNQSGWPINAEEVFGLLVEMLEKGTKSSPRASGGQQNPGRSSDMGG